MGCVQMSQFVAKERILKVSSEVSVSEMRHIGRRAWVQHFPWLAHVLQKPQSPSLHSSHFQKVSLASELQMSQKRPVCNLRAGSSLAICLSSGFVVRRGLVEGCWYFDDIKMWGVSNSGIGSLLDIARILSKLVCADRPNPAQFWQPRPVR